MVKIGLPENMVQIGLPVGQVISVVRMVLTVCYAVLKVETSPLLLEPIIFVCNIYL